MSQLTKPSECLGVFHFLLNEFGHHISCMYINGAYCHNFLSVSFGEVTQQVVNQLVELGHLHMEESERYVINQSIPDTSS